MKKKENNTKSKIVTAAWKLFYENGFENTTIDDIIKESKTSKGSFYHYFKSKESLLGSLAYLFDARYGELEQKIDFSQNTIDIMLYLNQEMFQMIENQVDFELLSHLYAQQLSKESEKEFIDHSREYYKLLRKVVQNGQEKGEITDKKTVSEIVRIYAISERALLYDWCLHGGNYSLKEYSAQILPLFLEGIKS